MINLRCCNELGISGHNESEKRLGRHPENMHENELRVKYSSTDEPKQSDIFEVYLFFCNYENIYKTTNFHP